MKRFKTILVSVFLAAFTFAPLGPVASHTPDDEDAEKPTPESTPLPTAVDAGWNGEKVCEVLTDNDEMRVARCTFPPGGGHERHSHPPHWGYILTGSTMRMTDAEGTNVRELNAGASWWSDGTEWHEVLNVGDTTGVYLIVEPKMDTDAD